jgi:hypothetical protein
VTDLLKQLPSFKWRGKRYPLASRSVSFAHETVQHKLQRRNQDLVEQTGAHNLVFSYTLPMREGLLRGGYGELFNVGLGELFRDIRNREPGELFDPILGIRRCIPSSFTDETDVQKRDGTDVRVEFTEAPDDEDEASEETATILDVLSAANAAEAPVVVPDPNNPGETIELSPFGVLDAIGDAIESINAVGAQAIAFVDRADAALENVAFRARKLENTVNTITSPLAHAVALDARSARDRAERARASRSQVVAVQTRTTPRSMSVTSLAALYGVSVDALMRTNPSLGRSPTVPQGTVIVIPSA